MKPSTMLFAAAMMAVVASSAAAQPATRYKTDAVRRFERNYVACLASVNDGVVESAIAQSVRMKWAIPSGHFDELRAKLAKLSASGRTPAIRYKAYLAGLVYDTPSMFAGEKDQPYVWDEDLFSAVSARAQKALLGYTM